VGRTLFLASAAHLRGETLVGGARPERHEEEIDGRRYTAVLLELPNACLLFISEGKLALGTLALAVPSQLRERPGITSVGVLGERHTLLARVLAERLAGLKGKIALVSLRAHGPETQVGPRALAMLKKVLEEAGREP